MTPRLLRLVLALFVLVACSGGDSSSPAESVDPARGPALQPNPAVPADPAVPGTPPSPGAPTSPAPAPTGDADGAGPGESCAMSVRIVNGRSEYDERCSATGGTTARQCTLEEGESAWSCLCTAASGAPSSCQAPAPSSGVVMPPPDCCPAG